MDREFLGLHADDGTPLSAQPLGEKLGGEFDSSHAPSMYPAHYGEEK